MLKTLAVWGSPGSGKSTVSLALAWELVKDKQNVLVVNTDCTVPNLPVYLPMLKTNEDGNASIGTVLDSANRTQETLKNKIHLHEKSACLGFMALESGETPLSYKTFEKSKMYSFLKLLQAQPVDYIIFDCQSNPMYNNFTLLALETADAVVRLLTPDVKGIEFCKSQCAWLNQSVNINTNRHIKVANPCKQISATDDVGAAIGGFDFVLPENNATYICFSSADKFGESTSAAGKDFDKTIKNLYARISKEVTENEIEL